MLDIEHIAAWYHETLKPFKRQMIREYLQYKILEIIYDSPLGKQLIFIGGTALRIVYNNKRFSEDLDFDNRGLTHDAFEAMTQHIQKKLSLHGYDVSIKNTYKGAFRCYLKFHGLLFAQKISTHKDEVLTIQLDTEPQHTMYPIQKTLLNMFDVFLRIHVAPLEVLLAQKIYAICKRKRAMSRDFYDTVYLFGRTKPDMHYLGEKLGIRSLASLKKELLIRCRALNFAQLSRDVEPFLYDPTESKKVLHFKKYITQIL